MKIVRTKRAFTLIELLVVIAIIAILATLIILMVGKAQTRARNSKAENDINEAGKSVGIYLAENEVILAAVAGSPGAGQAYIEPNNSSIFGVQKAFAAAGPSHGDVYSVAACNSFGLLFALTPQLHYYYLQLPVPPSSFYSFDYRTQDNKALANACPGANDYHQDSAAQTYTLLTNLDTSDGTSSAYYWINNGEGGSGAQASIPAP